MMSSLVAQCREVTALRASRPELKFLPSIMYNRLVSLGINFLNWCC
ncbi:hypothetical protein [Dactylococcopsis salina]|nr:hypothetical protein [Dactylococcopsis salina]